MRIFRSLVMFIFMGGITFSSCSSDGDNDLVLPDSYFTWNNEGEFFEAKNTERFAYSSGPNLVILGEATVEGQVVIALNNSAGHSGGNNKIFEMNVSTLDELIFNDSNDNTWSSKNPGGSATVIMDLYQEYDDATFVQAYIEGSFSGTLTSTSDTTVYVIENGVFGVVEN